MIPLNLALACYDHRTHPMRSLSFLLVLACSFLLPGADRLNTNDVDPTAAGMNKQRLSSIPARLQQFVDDHQTAGIVTILGHHGKLASFDAIGYQDVESKTPMQRNTLFRIASLTKPITCVGIMVLVDEGLLSVIDPVENYLPEYRGIKVQSCEGSTAYACEGAPPSRPIQIQDLMTHTSGLLSDEPVPEGHEPATLAELATLAAASQLLFEPGTRWNYSNVGYDILGRIIEIVAKQPFDVFLQQRIFAPLKMNDTSFSIPDEKVSRLATLYTLQNGALVPAPNRRRSSFQHPQIPEPAGGLVSTAEDLFRFNMMMRNKGTLDGKRVLSAAAVTLMTTNHTGNLKAGWVPGVGHGYGYEVVRDAEGMFRYNSVGSFVKGGAFRTYEWVDPEKDLVGVLMMQLTNGGGDTASEINTFLAMSAAAIE